MLLNKCIVDNLNITDKCGQVITSLDIPQMSRYLKSSN